MSWKLSEIILKAPGKSLTFYKTRTMKTSYPIFAFFTAIFLSLAPASIHAQTACKGKSTALETLGMQGGALLYSTYEIVGSIHDGLITETWEKETDFLKFLKTAP